MRVHKSKIMSFLGTGLLSTLFIGGLIGFSMSAQAQEINLKFNTSPTKQGWTYEHANNNLPEGEVFQMGRGVLHQDTVKHGQFQLKGGDNAYHLDVVESSHGFSITVIAQVLDYKHVDYKQADPNHELGQATTCSGSGATRVCDDTNLAGFCFQGYTGEGGSEVYGVCLTDVRILLWPDQGELYDTKAKHVYRLEVLPGVGAKLYVDNKLELSTGVVKRAAADHNANGLWFGDMTGGANAKVDIFEFRAQHLQQRPRTAAIFPTPYSGPNIAYSETPQEITRSLSCPAMGCKTKP